MDRFDLLALIGLGLLSTGLYLIYPPLALIVPGCFLLLIGLLGAV